MSKIRRIWRDERSAVPVRPAAIASATATALLGAAMIFSIAGGQHYRQAENWIRRTEAVQTPTWAGNPQDQPSPTLEI